MSAILSNEIVFHEKNVAFSAYNSNNGISAFPADQLFTCSINALCVLLTLSHRILKKQILRTSLVAQWLRIRLPMQGTRVRALLREDPTCLGATKPVSHSY